MHKICIFISTTFTLHSISLLLCFFNHLIPALPLLQHQLKRSRSVIRRMQSCILVYHTPCRDGYACTDIGERSLIGHLGPVASPFAHSFNRPCLTSITYPRPHIRVRDVVASHLLTAFLALHITATRCTYNNTTTVDAYRA